MIHYEENMYLCPKPIAQTYSAYSTMKYFVTSSSVTTGSSVTTQELGDDSTV